LFAFTLKYASITAFLEIQNGFVLLISVPPEVAFSFLGE
jgi:hypothetical protein